MAFNDIVVQDGPGAVWLVDVSIDNFATIAYRWSTISVIVSGNQYEARIREKGLGKITRGLGRESTPQASTVNLSLDNTDLGADWLVDRATVASQVFRARFRITLLMYPSGSPSGAQTKVIGTFKCLSYPARDFAQVSMTLSDDTMGLFNDVLTTPTVREWANDAGSTVSNCPIVSSYAPMPNPSIDWDTPLPLVFGEGWLNCFSADIFGSSGVGAMDGCRAIPVCVTTAPDDAAAHDVLYLRGVYGDNVLLGTDKWDGAGTTIGIPKTFTVPKDAVARAATDLTPGQAYTIWEPQKSQAITKDGASWRILWVKFNVFLYKEWWKLTHHAPHVGGEDLGGGTRAPLLYLVPRSPGGVGAGQDFRHAFEAFAYFQATGYPLSARTAVSAADVTTGINVIKDLISYYSHGSASDIDTASFANAAAQSPMAVQGVVLPVRPLDTRFRYSNQAAPDDALQMGVLRQTLSDICQSVDVDLFMTWSGQIGVLAGYFSFANLTATRLSIDETRCRDVSERIPSKGERWAPYNRVTLVAPDGTPHGPYDNPDTSVDWGVPLDKILQGKWLFPFNPVSPLYSQAAWSGPRRLESVVRPVVRFVTDREALQLDLGDLFTFTWSRGGSSGPYSAGAVFRVESMVVDPDTLEVGVEAVWVDDVTSIYPYLLDNEALLVRWDGVGGGALTVTDGSNIVTCAGSGFVSNGCQDGDCLVMLDATQAINVFTRFRKVRISNVDGASQIELDTSDTDFDAPGGTTIAAGQWFIEKGEQTYPDSVSDPTNYPNDGRMYGKASSDSDVYADARAANELL